MQALEQHARRRRAMIAVVCPVAMVVMGHCSCRNGENDMARMTVETDVETIQVRSPAFEEGGTIPRQYACDGEDVSPPLIWEPGPEGTRSIALIVDDPDAPRGTFVHWVLYDLPGHTQELPENMPRDKTLPNGAKQGPNGSGKIGYMGPCPPSDTHRYFFRVYALDAMTNLQPGKSKADLLEIMEAHILAQGQIMGTYKR
jgi:Raf kinase inhibitor-like YbhB/YbcL family protein